MQRQPIAIAPFAQLKLKLVIFCDRSLLRYAGNSIIYNRITKIRDRINKCTDENELPRILLNNLAEFRHRRWMRFLNPNGMYNFVNEMEHRIFVHHAELNQFDFLSLSQINQYRQLQPNFTKEYYYIIKTLYGQLDELKRTLVKQKQEALIQEKRTMESCKWLLIAKSSIRNNSIKDLPYEILFHIFLATCPSRSNKEVYAKNIFNLFNKKILPIVNNVNERIIATKNP